MNVKDPDYYRYVNNMMISCADITRINMDSGYTVAYETDGSSPSTVVLA